MPRFAARSVCLVSLVLASACGSNTPVAPAAPPLVPTVVSTGLPLYPQISVGQTVSGLMEYNGAIQTFELTAPTAGKLTVTVNWDEKDGSLVLQMGDKQSGFEVSYPPLTGRITVVAGQKYLITIADPAAWDYQGLHLAYTFKSSID